MKTFSVINYRGDIKICEYKKANAVFKTNEYDETEDVCVYKETVNIFDLLKENQELKKQLENCEKFKNELLIRNAGLMYNEKQIKNKICEATDELFNLKYMIYKPETRKENFVNQRKISSIIKILNGKDNKENESI